MKRRQFLKSLSAFSVVAFISPLSLLQGPAPCSTFATTVFASGYWSRLLTKEELLWLYNCGVGRTYNEIRNETSREETRDHF